MEFKNIVPGMTFEKEFIVFPGLKAQQSAQLLLSCRKAGKP